MAVQGAAAAAIIPDAGLRISPGPTGDVCKEARASRDAGIPWVTLGTTWEDLEPTADANLDPSSPATARLARDVQLAACAKALGLSVMLNITNAPAWASGRNGSNDPPRGDAIPQYGQFLSEVVPRLAPYVDAWVPWNEPNFDLFWAPPHDVARYVQIQRTAYVAIKQADPTAIVSSAPIVGTPTEAATPAWDYLEAMYANGLKGYADVIGFNFYPRTAPEAVVRDSRGRPASWALSSQPYLRSLVDKYDPGRPIWIEETSHSTCVNCNITADNAVGEATQADYLIRMYTYRRRYLQGITDRIFWYNARDLTPDRSDWFANQGLLRYDYSPKPAYLALPQLLVETPAGGGGGGTGNGGGSGGGTGAGGESDLASTPRIPVATLPMAAAKPPLPATDVVERTGVRVTLGRPSVRVARGRITLTTTAKFSEGGGVLRVQGYRLRKWRNVKTVRLRGPAKVRMLFADKGYLGLRVLLRPTSSGKFVASRVVRIPGVQIGRVPTRR